MGLIDSVRKMDNQENIAVTKQFPLSEIQGLIRCLSDVIKFYQREGLGTTDLMYYRDILVDKSGYEDYKEVKCSCGWQGIVKELKMKTDDDGRISLECPNCHFIDTARVIKENAE